MQNSLPSNNHILNYFEKRSFFYIFAALLIVITVIAFWPSLFNGFTNWDDNIYISDNIKIRIFTPKNILHIFTSTHYGGYEPLTEFVFALDYHLFKLNPFYYHLNNLILHCINVLLVFYLILLLSQKKVIAFLASLFWAIHPMRVESVAWATERKDVLFSLFFLAALILYIKYLRKKRLVYYIFSMVAFFISLLPKAQGLMFPFVLILTDYLEEEKINIKSLIKKIPYFMISGIFFLLLYFGEVKYSRMGSVLQSDFLKNILYANFGLVFYLIKFFLPIGLSASYPLPEKNWGTVMHYLYLAGPVFVITLGALIFCLKNKKKLLVYAALFYVINLFLVLQLKRTGTAVVADRYTYIPYIMISYLMVHMLYYHFFRRLKPLVLSSMLALFMAVIVTFSLLTWQQSRVWENNYTLWSDALKKHPETALAHHNMAATYAERKEYELSVKHYLKSIELNPTGYISYSNLAKVYIEMGQPQEAVKLFEDGYSLNRNDHQYIYNFGLVYINLEREDDALQKYRESIIIHPRFGTAFNAIGSLYYKRKEFDRAIENFLKAIETNSNDPSYHYNLGNAYNQLGEKERALEAYNKCRDISPAYAMAQLEAGILYEADQNLKEAIKCYRYAIEGDPSLVLAYNNLGICYAKLNDLKNAVKIWGKGLDLAPDNENMLYNYHQAREMMQMRNNF